MPRVDAGFDDEVFEPVVRIRVGSRRPNVYHGRTAARRGIWLGGTQHFDDCVVAPAPGAAALLIFEPSSVQWRLLPGAVQGLIMLPRPADGRSPPILEIGGELPRLPVAALAVSEPTVVPPEGCALERLSETHIRLSPDSPIDIVLEPGFVARRWSPASEESMPPVAATPAEARRMRERVMLMLIKTEVRVGYGPSPPEAASGTAAMRASQLGAVLTDFTVGRGEACNLRFPEALSVSRSHCVLALRDDPGDPGAARLFAYDDGSLGGTQLRGQPLGVGPRGAEPVGEGDTLRLGSDVTIRLQAVSPVLCLDDHRGLAAFFDRVGERRTAQTLRQAPRLTEVILSSSLSTGPRAGLLDAAEGGAGGPFRPHSVHRFNLFDRQTRNTFDPEF